MKKNIGLCVIGILCGISFVQAMDNAAPGYHALSINNSQEQTSLLLTITNDKTVKLIREWNNSKKSFAEWERDKYSHNEQSSLLPDAKSLIERIEILKKDSASSVEFIFINDDAGDNNDVNISQHQDFRAPLAIALCNIENSPKAVNDLKSSPVVAEVFTCSQENIKSRISGIKNQMASKRTMRAVSAVRCMSVCSLATWLIGIGMGIGATWFWMSSQEEQLSNQLATLTEQYNNLCGLCGGCFN